MIAGYLIKHPNGTQGINGLGYNYLMAAGGLYINALGPYLAARFLIAPAEIRGLSPSLEILTLSNGLIPKILFDLALNAFLADPDRERYLAITWDNGYHLWQPEQDISKAKVEYQTMDNVVMELHSHGCMSAFFTDQDNKDEQGFRIYGVIGKLRERPTFKLRVGVYGYFQDIKFADVFEGTCPVNEEKVN